MMRIIPETHKRMIMIVRNPREAMTDSPWLHRVPYGKCCLSLRPQSISSTLAVASSGVSSSHRQPFLHSSTTSSTISSRQSSHPSSPPSGMVIIVLRETMRRRDCKGGMLRRGGSPAQLIGSEIRSYRWPIAWPLSTNQFWTRGRMLHHHYHHHFLLFLRQIQQNLLRATPPAPLNPPLPSMRGRFRLFVPSTMRTAGLTRQRAAAESSETRRPSAPPSAAAASRWGPWLLWGLMGISLRRMTCSRSCLKPCLNSRACSSLIARRAPL
mmetsp:Transcript_37755/g.51130  ORF Transcript_37755/g.51130 Transcript_37755/m.51130 type:complete len:268 (+) Transcript_37755:365-1168(+)